MIEFTYQDIDFNFDDGSHRLWLENVVKSEGKSLGDITYLFCTDEHLHQINLQFLNHDTLTDIITFDNTMGNTVGADVCISIDRVRENALEFSEDFEEELRRVLVHGVLHICGYKDKSDAEANLMRSKEEEKMKMFHVEHID